METISRAARKGIRGHAVLPGVLLLALLAATSVRADEAHWVEGVPPLRMAERMGIAQPRFATLASCPGLTATVYVVAGRKRNEPFAALIIDSEKGPGYHSLPPGFVDGSQTRVTTTVSYSDVPAQEVSLELGRLSRSALWYEWGKPAQIGSMSLEEVFPELRAKHLEGGSWDSAELRGRVTVLNSWTTWCIPCVEEIPALNGLVEEFRDDPRVAFVAVSPESRRVVRKLVVEKPFAYSQVVSSNAVEVFGDHYPRHVVLGPDARVVFDHIGWAPDIDEQLRAAVRAARAGSDSSEASPAPHEGE